MRHLSIPFAALLALLLIVSACDVMMAPFNGDDDEFEWLESSEVISESLSFTVNAPQRVTAGDTTTLKLTLSNETDDVLPLRFGSVDGGFDEPRNKNLVLMDKESEEFVWSHFPSILSEQFPPVVNAKNIGRDTLDIGETITYPIEWAGTTNYSDGKWEGHDHSKAIEPGTYKIFGYMRFGMNADDVGSVEFYRTAATEVEVVDE